jgi:hypothetical protein
MVDFAELSVEYFARAVATNGDKPSTRHALTP